MTFENSTLDVIRYVSVPAPKLDLFAIDDKHGNSVHVFDAALIRLISERFRARYEVSIPDGGYGSKLSNGSWTGLLGAVERSEADLTMFFVSLTAERCKDFSFSYPHTQARLTFMTDKPTPVSKNLAIFYPFSYEIWMFLAICWIAVSIVFYIMKRGRKTFQEVLLRVFGSLLDQDIGLRVKRSKLRLLAISWFCGIMIITYSYKAVLLSFLSLPTLTGIRDISDLSKAISADAIQCFMFKGTFIAKELLESDDDSRKAIGKCLMDNEHFSGSPSEYFFEFPDKKAFVGGGIFLAWNDKNYFVSEDSFRNDYFGIVISKHFCCTSYLNELIHRFNAAGLLLRYLNLENFIFNLQTPSYDSGNSEINSKIELEDISGAFYILLTGWAAALITLLVEFVVKRYTVHENKVLAL